MAAKPNHPFRHAVFMLAVRNRLVRELMARDGMSRSEANQAAEALTDDVIEECALRVSGTAPAALHGKVLDSIIAFITSPEFLKLIATLLSLFGVGVAANDLAAPPV